MLPTISPVNAMLAQAADIDRTPAERAAAMNVASRVASETGITIGPLEPPPGYAMCNGRVVPLQPSGIVPPLRSGGDRWDELSWKRRLYGDEPEADNDNDGEPVQQQQQQPEPASATAVATGEALEPMPVPAIEPGRPAGTERRPDSKVATIARLIRRSTGATAEELAMATGSTLRSLRVMVYMLRRDGEDITFDRKTGRYSVAA